MNNTSRIGWVTRSLSAIALPCLLLATLAGCRAGTQPRPRTFASPDEAVGALIQAVKGGKLEDVAAMFGPDGQTLIDSADPVAARRNREVFVVAAAEKWRLEDQGPSAKTLVIGNEQWPFPIPLVKDGTAWRFDAAAGQEEVLARRIGRNELAAMGVCKTYVLAQRLYAASGHDGKPSGLYARSFHSDTGRQNGLYWPPARGQKPSPLGDLLAAAADEAAAKRASADRPQPFHGYYFKILTAQGAAAPGGVKNYLVNDELSGGFALVAWPAQYDATGIMTFLVNQDGVVYEKDLGAGTDAEVRSLTVYDPDKSWLPSQDAPR